MAPRRRILLLGWLALIAALYPVFGVGGGGVVSGERIASANSHAARISPGKAGALIPTPIAGDSRRGFPDAALM